MVMEDPLLPTTAPFARRIVPYVAAVVIGATGVGYAVHEHHAAQSLAAQNQQVTAELNATNGQLASLTAKVNALATRPEPAPPPVALAAAPPAVKISPAHRVLKPHASASDRRLSKLQSQLDAQGKEIEETRGDLVNTRTELTGSIAHTHDELVVLQKRGERNYFEFDIQKSKQFQHEGPFGIRLKKANTKHQYADLELMVDDRNLSQKHVNLYQPVMFYTPDTPQAVEVVINDITKDHIHGYVSAPKYRQSELASMSSAAASNPAATSASAAPTQAVASGDQATNSAPPPPRRKLTPQ